MENANNPDRLVLYAHSLDAAEAIYSRNPRDADNLTRWGGILLEVSQIMDSLKESEEVMQEAIEKLEEALNIEPTKAVAYWTIGNVYLHNAFMVPRHDDACKYFEKALKYFAQSSELEQHTDLYVKSVQVVEKMIAEPNAHKKFHKEWLAQQAKLKRNKAAKKNGQQKDKDHKIDIVGWAVFAVTVIACIGFAKRR